MLRHISIKKIIRSINGRIQVDIKNKIDGDMVTSISQTYTHFYVCSIMLRIILFHLINHFASVKLNGI